ncbi:50S ribosomal protein L18 [bacterium]|nr:50S ribosomal protein L18 [bacterium]
MATRYAARHGRRIRIRRGVKGTPDKPRLAVFRSAGAIYAQVIDDTNGRTLASASTIDREIRAQVAGQKPVAAAKIVGQAVGVRALAAGVKTIVFDRGGHAYHGRVAALAAGARESLTF